MGFLDLFSKDGRDQRAREKNAARAINKYAQSPDRMKALQALRDDGSDEALYGADAPLRHDVRQDASRTSRRRSGSSRSLVEKGAAALPALKKYLLSADSISWPLRLLDKVVDAEGRTHRRHRRGARAPRAGLRARPDQEDPAPHPPRRASSTRACRRWSPRTWTTWTRASATRRSRRCCEQGDEAVGARAAARALRSKEDSLRLRIRIADGFAELGWPVADRRAEVEKMLPDAYQIEATRRRRAASRRNPERRNNRQPCRNAKTSRQSCSSGRVRS